MFNGLDYISNDFEFYEHVGNTYSVQLKENCKSTILVNICSSGTFDLILPSTAAIGKRVKVIVLNTVGATGVVNVKLMQNNLLCEFKKGGSAEFTFFGGYIDKISGYEAYGKSTGWLTTQPVLLADSTTKALVTNGATAFGAGAISNTYATAIGFSATASSTGSVALGNSSGASGSYAVALGNSSATVGNVGVSIGYTATAATAGAISIGNCAGFGTSSAGTSVHIRPASSYGIGATNGDSTIVMYMLHKQTTDATVTALTSSNTAPTTTNIIGQLNNTTISITGTVVGRETATGDSAMWEVKFLMRRGANASTTVLVGTPTINKLFNDTGATAWALGVVADTTNGGVYVSVTGEAVKTIKWTSNLTGCFLLGV